MYEIRGINFSFNTAKVIYVAEELGVDYSYTQLDLSTGKHKEAEHLARHPVGKLPTLTVNGRHIFESGAICRYMASATGSKLYPADALARAEVDQWMDFFSIHLGRWLSTVQFERVFRAKFEMGETKQDVVDEALGFVKAQLTAVDARLASGGGFLAGAALSIADIFAFAYVETTEMSDISLTPYAAVSSWYQQLKGRDAIARAKAKLA